MLKLTGTTVICNFYNLITYHLDVSQPAYVVKKVSLKKLKMINRQGKNAAHHTQNFLHHSYIPIILQFHIKNNFVSNLLVCIAWL
jgi:hypothetical protein